MTGYRSSFDPTYPAGHPTHLECQECYAGMMDIHSGPEGGEYIVECDECGWAAHASVKAVDTGRWED